MYRSFSQPLTLLLLCACLAGAPDAAAHGSVTADKDLCVINIGFYRAHFTIYQPRSRDREEFCEDLPDVGETVFVMDYLHRNLREVPVDFRIVRDRENLGRFARYEDIEKIDLERDTVFYQPPVTEPNAVFSVLHHFAEPGDYIGVVTAAHPTQRGKIYNAVFPFEVGGTSWLTIVLGVLGALILVTAGTLGWYLRPRSGTAGKTF